LMRLAKDTPLEMEAVQLELFRKASPAKRFALMSSFSSTLRQASLRQLEQRFGFIEARYKWIQIHYGEAIAKSLGDKLKVSRSGVNETEEALQALVAVFQNMKIPYRIVGSVASSTQGMMRSTLDIDMVAKVEAQHISQLALQLQNEYHLDEELAIEAVKKGSSFNLIHLATMIKIDIFILGKRPYDVVSFERERLENLDGLTLSFKTPEDVILGKLEWFVQTDKTSERQWSDIVGLMKVQAGALDMDYMQTWAGELGISELLGQALKDAKG
jgi:hypothetical protein